MTVTKKQRRETKNIKGSKDKVITEFTIDLAPLTVVKKKVVHGPKLAPLKVVKKAVIEGPVVNPQIFCEKCGSKVNTVGKTLYCQTCGDVKVKGQRG